MNLEKNIVKIDMIENYRKEHNLTKGQFCNLCNISSTTYRKILNNENVNITSFFKIAKLMNMHICKLF